MPRPLRESPGDICYHVMNRGNGQATVFRKPQDFAAFVDLMDKAIVRSHMRLLSFCLMPNHFHLVLWPHEDGDLSRCMQWLATTHVRRYHAHHGTSGHLWQGRFRSFPIQEDYHLLTVLRYVERNPLRAGLVQDAREWRWSSISVLAGDVPRLSPWPIQRPESWADHVNEALTDAEVESLHHSMQRGAPFGSQQWTRRTAEDMGLAATLRPRGRPRGKGTKGSGLLC